MSELLEHVEDIGAATFLGSPYVALDKVERGMVVIGGAPHDSTHTSRFGTRMGPPRHQGRLPRNGRPY